MATDQFKPFVYDEYAKSVTMADLRATLLLAGWTDPRDFEKEFGHKLEELVGKWVSYMNPPGYKYVSIYTDDDMRARIKLDYPNANDETINQLMTTVSDED